MVSLSMMLNTVQFQELQKRFVAGARELEKTEQYDLAYYLGGYATECAIKAIICKSIPASTFPPRNPASTHYIHKIETLLGTANLQEALELEISKDNGLKVAFQIVKDWIPDSRYELSKMTRKDCQEFLDSVEVFIKWLEKQS